jgi:hypothetical protein
MSDVTLRYLSIIIALITLLGFTWAGFRRLFRYLAQLDELPGIKKSIEDSVRQAAEQHLQNVTRMTALETRVSASQEWHSDHLIREHGQRTSSRPRNGG